MTRDKYKVVISIYYGELEDILNRKLSATEVVNLICNIIADFQLPIYCIGDISPRKTESLIDELYENDEYITTIFESDLYDTLLFILDKVNLEEAKLEMLKIYPRSRILIIGVRK